jgi:hypothetical protein
VALQCRRTGEADEIAVDNLPKVDHAAAGKFAALRRDHDQPVRAEREPLDGVGQGVFGREAEIGDPPGDRLRDVGALTLLDIETDVRMLAEKRGKRFRQMLRQPDRIRQHVHAGLGATGIGGEIAAHDLDVLQHDAGMAEQIFAGRGRRDAPAAPRQQRAAPWVMLRESATATNS